MGWYSMSQQLINRSQDLRRLRDEGYDIEIRSAHLLIKDVPYVNSNKEVKRGIVVSDLSLSGDETVKPGTHVAYLAGEYPCNKDGAPIEKIRHTSSNKTICEGVVVNHSFSSKPAKGYLDYYDKMTTYIAILSSPAQFLDPSVTAKTFPVILSKEEESVFQYVDTSSSRSGITVLSKKLNIGRIAIVGLGGTGSYVLDFVAKTPVGEISLFDGDRFLQHNGFRSPGAATVDELKAKPYKVDYFKGLYSRMRKNITANPFNIDFSNVELLREFDFVFLCIDGGNVKPDIINKLVEFRVPFVDTGMGLYQVDKKLGGQLRVTTCTADKQSHIIGGNRISNTVGEVDNVYSQNIQIAEMNALNAALAVIKWKKLCGFYVDLENEHHCSYTIDGNNIINEDRYE
jgi:tRNA A37 threonylcarbamoyladenosine dehydratase